jgi:DedD protein
MRLPFLSNKDKAPTAAPRGSVGAEEAQVLAARTQARQRLVGALVLLVAGVIGFPILFETQPRPLPVDTPILVPEGTPARVAAAPGATASVVARPLPTLPPDAGTETAAAPGKPGFAASAPTKSAPAASSPATPAPAASALPAAAQAAPATAPKALAVAASAPKPPVAPKAAAATLPIPAVAKPAPSPAPASAVAKSATEPPAASGGRYVVQVGAYNDLDRMKAARAKLEKLGFKSFTQDVESSTGKRTRVRVGPFNSKQEAEDVAAKVKAGGQQAAIL